MQETIYHLNTPVSIGLVADLHERPHEAILSSLRSHKPDIIAIPGDLFHGNTPSTGVRIESSPVLPFLTACAQIAPTFCSLGNHECILHPDDLALLRSSGITLLENSFVSFGNIVIGGLTSARFLECQAIRGQGGTIRKHSLLHSLYLYVSRNAQWPKPALDWLEDFEAQPGYKLLLCHHPEYYPQYLKGRNIHLILSGHAHGGQWRLFGHGVIAPGQGIFPHYTSGVHDERLVISRGLANTTRIPRFFNPTEIVYIEPAL